jgi:hypothetical protein
MWTWQAARPRSMDGRVRQGVPAGTLATTLHLLERLQGLAYCLPKPKRTRRHQWAKVQYASPSERQRHTNPRTGARQRRVCVPAKHVHVPKRARPHELHALLVCVLPGRADWGWHWPGIRQASASAKLRRRQETTRLKPALRQESRFKHTSPHTPQTYKHLLRGRPAQVPKHLFWRSLPSKQHSQSSLYRLKPGLTAPVASPGAGELLRSHCVLTHARGDAAIVI